MLFAFLLFSTSNTRREESEGPSAPHIATIKRANKFIVVQFHSHQKPSPNALLLFSSFPPFDSNLIGKKNSASLTLGIGWKLKHCMHTLCFMISFFCFRCCRVFLLFQGQQKASKKTAEGFIFFVYCSREKRKLTKSSTQCLVLTTRKLKALSFEALQNVTRRAKGAK